MKKILGYLFILLPSLVMAQLESNDQLTNDIEFEKTDDNKKIIDDSFLRLSQLEEQYSKLMIELKQSHEDKRVIFAMISNYQQRIEILQNLMNQLENIKQLKTTNYESYI